MQPPALKLRHGLLDVGLRLRPLRIRLRHLPPLLSRLGSPASCPPASSALPEARNCAHAGVRPARQSAPQTLIPSECTLKPSFRPSAASSASYAAAPSPCSQSHSAVSPPLTAPASPLPVHASLFCMPFYAPSAAPNLRSCMPVQQNLLDVSTMPSMLHASPCHYQALNHREPATLPAVGAFRGSMNTSTSTFVIRWSFL